MQRFVRMFLAALVIASATSALAQQVTPGHSSISQIASGGGWKTTLTLLNLSSSASSVTVTFQNDDGMPLVLPLIITQEGTSQPQVSSVVVRVVPALATLLIESEAPPNSETATGWADVASFRPFAGFAIFRQRGQDGRDSEGTAPLEGTGLPGLILPFDNSAGFSTGIAMVNPGADRANLVAIVRDENGLILGQFGVPLIARGHTAFVVAERLAASKGRRGSIEFQHTGNGTVTGLGLRFSTSGSFTSVPGVPIAAR
ncbi:MAG: hypothetical protein JWP63_5563 [Candidatus Solibacter sp.]|nr:hypothetical protein [Candidatus Solibacter sp.]